MNQSFRYVIRDLTTNDVLMQFATKEQAEDYRDGLLKADKKAKIAVFIEAIKVKQ